MLLQLLRLVWRNHLHSQTLLIQELLAPVFVGLEPDLMLQIGSGQVYLWCLRYFECSLRCWMRVLDPDPSPG